MIEYWTRNREMGDEDQHNVEDIRGYGKSKGRLASFGWEDHLAGKSYPRSGFIPAISGIVY
jgi:hypothetical protein